MSKITTKTSHITTKDSKSLTPEIIPEPSHLVKARQIPIETIIAYAKQGLTQKEIGKILGIARETVSVRLAKADLRGLTHYKSHKADSLEHLCRRIQNSITDDDIKSMATDRKVWSVAVLLDKIRLERGQSTANISVNSTVDHYSKQLEDLQSKIAEMMAA